jgi:hypothetical protein
MVSNQRMFYKTLEAQFRVFKKSTYSCLTHHHKRFLIQADMKANPKLVNQEGSKKKKKRKWGTMVYEEYFGC